MCIPTKLQQNIISFTKDGEHIARFLTETMRGETPGVKVNHRLEAAKHLIRYGFPDEACRRHRIQSLTVKTRKVQRGMGAMGTKPPSKSPLPRGEG